MLDSDTLHTMVTQVVQCFIVIYYVSSSKRGAGRTHVMGGEGKVLYLNLREEVNYEYPLRHKKLECWRGGINKVENDLVLSLENNSQSTFIVLII